MLRCAANRTAQRMIHIRLAIRFLRALHLNIFEQSLNIGFFNKHRERRNKGLIHYSLNYLNLSIIWSLTSDRNIRADRKSLSMMNRLNQMNLWTFF
jgi:hypothetical protein